MIKKNAIELKRAKIFGSRIVNEVKGKDTKFPYEKSRWVVQGFNDPEKKLLLTKSPTIQRVSQHLIISLTPSLRSLSIRLYMRDITQAYTQSKTPLNRVIYTKPLTKLLNQYPNIVFKILKPLYEIAKARNH